MGASQKVDIFLSLVFGLLLVTGGVVGVYLTIGALFQLLHWLLG